MIWFYRNGNVKSQNKEIPKDEKIGELEVNKYDPHYTIKIVCC